MQRSPVHTNNCTNPGTRSGIGLCSARNVWAGGSSGYEKLNVLPSLFKFQHLSTVQSDSSPARNTQTHTHRAHTVFGALLLSKPEFTEEHILFMFYAIYVIMLHKELFGFLQRNIKNPYSAICGYLWLLKWAWWKRQWYRYLKHMYVL